MREQKAVRPRFDSLTASWAASCLLCPSLAPSLAKVHPTNKLPFTPPIYSLPTRYGSAPRLSRGQNNEMEIMS